MMTWIASKFPNVRNRVELTLEPIRTGTRLTLRHSGLAEHPEAYADYETGWVDVLGHLVAWALALAASIAATGAGDTRE